VHVGENEKSAKRRTPNRLVQSWQVAGNTGPCHIRNILTPTRCTNTEPNAWRTKSVQLRKTVFKSCCLLRTACPFAFTMQFVLVPSMTLSSDALSLDLFFPFAFRTEGC
jgi:hypothetical protein